MNFYKICQVAEYYHEKFTQNKNKKATYVSKNAVYKRQSKEYIQQKPDGTLFVEYIQLDRDALNAMKSWQDLVDMGVSKNIVGIIAREYGGHPKDVDVWLERNSVPFQESELTTTVKSKLIEAYPNEKKISELVDKALNEVITNYSKLNDPSVPFEWGSHYFSTISLENPKREYKVIFQLIDEWTKTGNEAELLVEVVHPPTGDTVIEYAETINNFQKIKTNPKKLMEINDRVDGHLRDRLAI